MIFYSFLNELLILKKFRQADFRLMHWLNMQEDIYPLIIYECDEKPTNWTKKCLRQADVILFVAKGDQEPDKKSFVSIFISFLIF